VEKKMWAACAALVVVPWARAEEPDCPPVADVPALVRCALSRSDSVAKSRGELQAALGRRVSAGQLLPSNPALDVSLGRRRAESGRSDLDRGVELSQAIELGGQRGARIAGADVEEIAARAVLAAAEREVVADVLSSVIAVDRGRAFARHAAEEAQAARRLEAVSAGRVAQGVGSALDADLALAARVEAERASARADRDAREAEALLVTVVGEAVRLADGARLPSPWVPSRSVDAMEHDALERRAAVQVARAQARAGSARVDLLRRERVPDVTFGVFLRHEEFSDVVGGRIGVALPLFRRNQGAIAEAEGRVVEAEAALRRAEREARLELRTAYARWERTRDIARGIPQGTDERLGAALQRLQDAYARGSVPLPGALSSIREVIAARRSVLDARAEALVSSFELAKVAGAALDVSVSRGDER
jgi:cobalt-zinc-cadmium efflux system outer membrane protein